MNIIRQEILNINTFKPRRAHGVALGIKPEMWNSTYETNPIPSPFIQAASRYWFVSPSLKSFCGSAWDINVSSIHSQTYKCYYSYMSTVWNPIILSEEVNTAIMSPHTRYFINFVKRNKQTYVIIKICIYRSKGSWTNKTILYSV